MFVTEHCVFKDRFARGADFGHFPIAMGLLRGKGLDCLELFKFFLGVLVFIASYFLCSGWDRVFLYKLINKFIKYHTFGKLSCVECL